MQSYTTTAINFDCLNMNFFQLQKTGAGRHRNTRPGYVTGSVHV